MKFILLLALLFGIPAGAKIRTVHVNADKMQTIRLSMGKSTVLRFLEKPRKVVVGNKNYFNIEFINNDVTIQPLGEVSTNLFVYGEYHTYGFLLKVCNHCVYDDKLDVRWRSSYRPAKKLKRDLKAVKATPKEGLRSFWIDGVFKVAVERVEWSKKWGVYIIDISVKNGKKFDVRTIDFSFWLSRGGEPLKEQKFVFRSDSIPTGGTAKGRFLLNLPKKKGFSLNGKIGKKESKTIISRSML